jgi:hypothetical protein
MEEEEIVMKRAKEESAEEEEEDTSPEGCPQHGRERERMCDGAKRRMNLLRI